VKSLRTRLVAGVSLVAVLPLSAALLLFGSRVKTLLETQTADRLRGSLTAIQEVVRQDGRSAAGKLELLANDPALKRLFFLRSAWSRDLNDYVGARRALLGLDFLTVVDSNGTIVATASSARGAQATAMRPDGPSSISSEPTIETLADSSGLSLTASAPILYRDRIAAGVLRGGVILDGDALRRLGGGSGLGLALRDRDGRTVATTLGGVPIPWSTIPPEGGRVRLGGGSVATLDVPLDIGAPPFATILGATSTAATDEAIASLRTLTGLLALLGLGLSVVLAVLWSRQVSRPVERLAAFSQKLAQGEWDEPLTLKSVRELETLVSALDRMRSDLKAYRERLLASERQAAWSQMARKVAHEVKNPLTPIAISVADLKRSYAQQRPDFPAILDQAVRTVEEEVATLRRMLQEFSDYGRFPTPRIEPCRAADLIADLEALYAPEAAAGRIEISRPAADLVVPADRAQIRQALINLVKNGFEATEGGGRVTVAAARNGRALEITIADSGPGLTADQRANLFAPGFTTKPGGSGLGLTIVERIVSDHRGTIAVSENAPHGTVFRIDLPLAPGAMP
jgi:two-component system nitrogen regulation sensor histidine kinase NtrY